GGGINAGALAAGVGLAGAGVMAADSGGGSGAPAPETFNRADFLSGGISSSTTDIVAEGASTIVFTIGDDEQAPVAVDADGNWTLPAFSGAEADALPQGEVEVSWTSFDSDGEEVDSGTETVIIDTIPPVVAIDGPIAGDDVINAAEQDAALTVSGTTDAEDGQEVTVTVNGVEYTATAAGGAWSVEVPAADLAGLGDGDTVAVTADVADAAGNPAAQASASVDTDFSAGIAIDAIGDLNAASRLDDFEITGTSTGVEAGQTVTVTFNGTDYTGDVQGDGTWSVTVPQADMAAIGDEVSEVTASAEVSDAAGNGASASQDVAADFSEPSISIADPADGSTIGIEVQEAGELTVSGSTGNVSAGQEVTLEIRDGAGAVVLSATPAVAADGSWTHTFADISGLADETGYTISTEVEDAGLTASASADVSVDYKPIVALDDLGDDEGALILEDLDPSDSEISGTTVGIEDGQAVTVRITDADGTELLNDTATVTANAWALAVPAAVIDALEAGMDYTVTANAANAAGRDADEASETVTGYAEAPNYLIAGGADGTELSMQIFMDPRFELPGDRGVSLGEEVSFDTSVLAYLADPAPVYTAGLTGITNASSADTGQVTFGSIGFLPGTFEPSQDALVSFAMNVADAGTVAQIDVETSGGGSYTSFIGTASDDTIAANNVDSVVQGRGGDDAIDISAPGANT
ncbi:Ig-like domain-containing protein, partial [Aquicoccus porphyridii]